MTRTGMSRRGALKGLALAGCCPRALSAAPPPHDEGIAADFRGPAATRVTLEYWDPEHFRLIPAVGGAETWVVMRRIYLRVRASLLTANAERVLWVGEVQAALPPQPSADPPLAETALPPEEVAGWRLGAPVHDIAVAGRVRPSTVLSVAGLPRLARAQYMVDRRMRAGMDMSVCGDGIDRLTASWNADLTGRGLAVVADHRGFRLAGALRELRTAGLTLPAGVPVEDYRLSPAR